MNLNIVTVQLSSLKSNSKKKMFEGICTPIPSKIKIESCKVVSLRRDVLVYV